MDDLCLEVCILCLNNSWEVLTYFSSIDLYYYTSRQTLRNLVITSGHVLDRGKLLLVTLKKLNCLKTFFIWITSELSFSVYSIQIKTVGP